MSAARDDEMIVRRLRRRYRDKFGVLLTLDRLRVLRAHDQVIEPDFTIEVLHELQNQKEIDQ